MKRYGMLCLLILLMAGCSQNNREKAIEYLYQHQVNDASLIVFTNKPAERYFITDLQTNMDYINNQKLREEGPVTNVNFYDVRDEQQFNYEQIFNMSTYPYMILIEKGQIVLETQEPEEIVKYYEKR
ncbi:hypothetical protein ACM7Q1_15580 [Paenibacillus illinoisensis]|uniref:hypothetical protein n=1 Tax=Paenibacillus illinoisensis TaxID=59845 RepID=UPI003A4E4FBB